MIYNKNDMTTSASEIEGLYIIHLKLVTDERGTVRELFRFSAYSEILPPTTWSQVNLTLTKIGAVRGLHAESMSKLLTVAKGTAFGVYVDIRKNSASFGKVVTVDLYPGVQVFVPNGVCNGFQALEDDTEYLYFFDNEWIPGMSGQALSPLASDLKIEWPIPINPNNLEQISEKDLKAPNLHDIID
ncbi:dTDP-4-dehydrorhamnose 3,5-epimerase [Streptococcus urinalis FB127-CNA-2]|uniref:dTDP-4-dehydrorhamnose 3,5-epimerase n=1 Tax=Streptococcus urinalis 2285-97 TaxID=764291 RepID=G5KFL7_9STRE|nr:dTDP-4-dehydrorhamnose 3,5-epimerase [Streptococcus urinalis]EHJ57701.1 putative dTDP-4-dehydrorhamnose 3,5-epimerase [Streptococcus urinalis 2285-97]EKS22080.1 dTDP-4-dehydrorhamnose 3,5-epimerase [Streptococcus urinalis FB127-CNA-2]VEF31892.1 dTDP-4-dehydrorhamnose 3,5-epimerase or related enzyme [Streptococcus urinalis]